MFGLWLCARQSALLYDITFKRFLIKDHIHDLRHPASLTKEMTLYLLFQALKERRITLKTKFKVSYKASRQAPSKIHLKPGERISVEKLIHSMVVKSANDSAVCVAENLCSCEKAFVHEMNKMAKKLGMRKTYFANPSGLPDERNISTAYDLLKLSHALYRDFPQYFHFFKMKKFQHKSKTFYTRYRLLHKPGIYGIKTGYIHMSGYNVATSAIRFDRKKRPHFLIAIVLGQDSAAQRDQKVLNMLNQFF